MGINIQHKILFSSITAIAAMMPTYIVAADQYPVNFPADATIADRGRYINSVTLTSNADGVQEIPVKQGDDMLLYHDVTNMCFAAVAGETVIASFDWMGGWMHGYVYLDRENDGNFNTAVGENGAIPDNSDVMAFSNYAGYSSAGAETANGNVGVYPPSFTMPENLEPGLYRMRYKIDWNSIDPGGNDENGEIHQQTILANGGGIADVLVYLHKPESGVDVESEHGKVYDYDGVDITESGIKPGEPFGLMIDPDNGYRVSGITIESGYDLNLPDGVELALKDLKRTTSIIPPYLIVNNEVEIPASYTYGKVKITVSYAEKGADEAEDYACSLSGSKRQTEGFMNITLSSGKNASTAAVNSTKRHMYYEKSVLHAVKTEKITPSFVYRGTGNAAKAKINFYIDLNQDGAFSADMGELLSTCTSTEALPSFELPSTLSAGVYRARMEAEGIAAVDFLLNLHNEAGIINMDVKNGYVMGANGKAVAATINYGSNTLVVTPLATLPGFEAATVTVRHGHNLTRQQYIRGNKQWDEIEVPVGESTQIAPSMIDGDILIKGNFEETDDSEWTAIWSDEFDGKKLDTNKWGYHPRYSSAWNRFIAQGKECEVVNIIEDGQYKSYCIPTPDEFKATEKNPMISGAIYTNGKFYCTGGWIEARIKTTPHTGNFPAFWMMPTTPLAWPTAGEIDIWEQINNENIAHHTIHSAWANPGDHNLGRPLQPSPAKGGAANCTSNQWHVYALEWDQESMKFYVDGKLNFTYHNMHYTDPIYTEELSWPFSKPFYIICNQSVGTGSWAAAPDTQFSYHTEFDYVRVYQKKDALNYYSTADGFVSGIDDVIIDNEDGVFDPDAPVEYYDLRGIRVNADNMPAGIYILRQGSYTTKFIKK